MKQIPNIFTLLNLFFGCLAVVFILQNNTLFFVVDQDAQIQYPSALLTRPETIYWASACIGIAAIIDFLDGLVARLLNYASEMGKQLDSLADVVSFGVAPAMIIYQFLRLSYAQHASALDTSALWLVPAFALPCAGAYRLARFNLDKNRTCYFSGVPIPAAGLLVASFPLIYWYTQSPLVINVLLNKWFWYGIIAALSALMVSRLPMMALKLKGMSLKKDFPKLILLVLAILLGIIIKWLAVPVVFVVYVLLSLSMKKYVTGITTVR